MTEASVGRSGLRPAPATEKAKSGGGLMKRLLSISICVCAFAGIIAIGGCGGGGTGNSISLALLPGAKYTMGQGQTVTYMATLQNDVTNSGVTWEIYNSTSTNPVSCSIPSCGTLSNSTPFSVTYTSPTGLFGAQNISLEATSKANINVTSIATISIVLPPLINTLSLPNGQNGIPYNQTLSVSYGVTPLNYSIISGSLPAGLAMNSNSQISGTPSGSGTSQFTVQVADSGIPPETASMAYTITIAPPPPLSIATNLLLQGVEGTPYTGTIAATGGIPPLMWTLTGNLPPGLTLATNTEPNSSTAVTTGTISGTPTATGTSTFTIEVEDSALPPQFATRQLSVTINPPGSVHVTTVSLPAGVTAQGYSEAVQATGGIAPLTWSVAQGQLPPGLTLNAASGTITGLPLRQGTSDFTIEVTDSSQPSVSASADFSIVITENTNPTKDNQLLDGVYAFLFNGFGLANGSPVYPETVIGTFTASGTGSITAGTEDIQSTSAESDLPFTGSYNIGPDGRGTLQLTVTGAGGQMIDQTFQMALDSQGNGQFIEMDKSGNRGSGVFRKQSSTTFTATSFSGNYAFLFNGYDTTLKRTVVAGQFTANGSSGLGSGTADVNDGGVLTPYTGVNGSFGNVSGNGRGSAILFFTPNTQSFTFYIVSPTEVFFVSTETTAPDGTITISPPQSGVALLESGGPFAGGSLDGNYVITGTGLTMGGDASVFGSLMSLGPSGSTSGQATPVSFDQNDGGTISSALPTASTYTVQPNSRMAFTGGTNRLGVGYIVSPSEAVFIGADPEITSGFIELQTSGPVFSEATVQGEYALGGPFLVDGQTTTISGVPDADGVGDLTGITDFVTGNGTQTLAQPLTGSYTVDASGRGALTPGSGTGLPASLALYVLSPTDSRLVSIDPTDAHPQVLLMEFGSTQELPY
ncbi:MAG: Ig domain-containing protein [Candidatus Acidiferrales bacterium]